MSVAIVTGSLGLIGAEAALYFGWRDLVTAFHAFWRNPRCAAVYNIGGGPKNNCTVLEAIDLCQAITGLELNWTYQDQARMGDHMWWISSLEHFQTDYSEWQQEYTRANIAAEIADAALVPPPQ